MSSPFRDSWLITLCASRALSALVFVTYAATLPVVAAEWHMSGTEAGAIASVFQAAYAVSLLAFSWLAQRVGARSVLLHSSVLIALAGCLFAGFARDFLSAFLLYGLVGISLGGNYTTAIMLIADRYEPARRGSAMGALLASTSMGYAAGLLVSGFALPIGGYIAAFWATAAGPVIGAVLLFIVLRDTPNIIHPPVPGGKFTGAVLGNKTAMRLTVGYTFHAWELLGMWAWTPAFLAACLAFSGSGSATAAEIGAYLTGALHVAGVVASLTMGRLSDRLGRRAVLLAMATLGMLCSFTFGWQIGGPIAVLVVLALVYGFTALGDSAVLSTAFTEAVPPAYLGTGLALRSLLGFGAGAVSPLVFGMVLDATNVAGSPATVWGWAFVSLGVGGLIATIAAFGLPRTR